MLGWFKSRKKEKNVAYFHSTVAQLLTLQLLPSYSSPKEAFGALMTSKPAAGYVFGFHDALLQSLGLRDPSNKEHAASLIQSSYQSIFGQQAGYALYSMSLAFQNDPVFSKGRMNGGNEVAEFIDNRVPPLGLGRILVLGLEA